MKGGGVTLIADRQVVQGTRGHAQCKGISPHPDITVQLKIYKPNMRIRTFLPYPDITIKNYKTEMRIRIRQT